MEDATRRELLAQVMMALPVTWLASPTARAAAQTPTPVKVDTRGLTARIKYEHVLAGYLTELNGKYKLRVTELTLEPGGHVGEHDHVESGDINHTVYNKTDKPNQHLLFEILPAELQGPSLMPVKSRATP